MGRSNSDDFPVQRAKFQQEVFKTGTSGKKVNVEELHLISYDKTVKQVKLTKDKGSLETDLLVRLLPGKKRLSVEITEIDYAKSVEAFSKAEEKRERRERERKNGGGYVFGGGYGFGGGFAGYDSFDSDSRDEYRNGQETIEGTICSILPEGVVGLGGNMIRPYRFSASSNKEDWCWEFAHDTSCTEVVFLAYTTTYLTYRKYAK